MKATIYFQPGKPDVLHYTDVPDPACGPDEVRIRVEDIALEGGDIINRATAPLPHKERSPDIPQPELLLKWVPM